jgi:hypothetical protein
MISLYTDLHELSFSLKWIRADPGKSVASL